MKPKPLKKGDTIGIIAPSNPITDDRRHLLDNFVEYFKQEGFNIKFSKNLFSLDKFKVSAGEPQKRADDLNAMFKDNEVDAIYCAHGGDTANQILSLIDYEAIKNNPKQFIGMSDVDVLSLAINKETGLITFNGSDPKMGRGFDFDFPYTKENFNKRLIQHSKIVQPYNERTCVRGGTAQGKILGCNLASLLKILGTQYLHDFSDSILFLELFKEDKGNALFKLQQLKDVGIFDRIKGLVIGYIIGFQNEECIQENNIDVDFIDIIKEITKGYTFPILKTNDFGHKNPTCFLPIGARAKLDADKKTIEIIDDFLQ